MSLHILVQYRVHSHRWNQDHRWQFLKISWYSHFIIALSVNKIHPKLTVETDDHRFIFKIPIAQNQYCAGRNRRCWRSSCCRSGCCSRRCSCCGCCSGDISSRRGIWATEILAWTSRSTIYLKTVLAEIHNIYGISYWSYIGHFLLDISYWTFLIGHFLSVISYWSFLIWQKLTSHGQSCCLSLNIATHWSSQSLFPLQSIRHLETAIPFLSVQSFHWTFSFMF